MVLRDGNLARRMGADACGAAGYAAVSRILERIGDHAVRIAKSAVLRGDRPLDPGVAARLRTASAFSLALLDRALAAFATRDMPLANRAIEEVRRAEQLCGEAHTAALAEPAGPAVALGYVAESVRRSAEYAGDIAETVINCAVAGEA